MIIVVFSVLSVISAFTLLACIRMGDITELISSGDSPVGKS